MGDDEADRVFPSVLFREAELTNRPTRLINRIDDYLRYNINKHYGLTITDLLELTPDEIDVLIDRLKIKLDYESDTNDELVEELKGNGVL